MGFRMNEADKFVQYYAENRAEIDEAQRVIMKHFNLIGKRYNSDNVQLLFLSSLFIGLFRGSKLEKKKCRTVLDRIKANI